MGPGSRCCSLCGLSVSNVKHPGLFCKKVCSISLASIRILLGIDGLSHAGERVKWQQTDPDWSRGLECLHIRAGRVGHTSGTWAFTRAVRRSLSASPSLGYPRIPSVLQGTEAGRRLGHRALGQS